MQALGPLDGAAGLRELQLSMLLIERQRAYDAQVALANRFGQKKA